MAVDKLPIAGTAFSEAHVEADGFAIRYRESGNGEPLVCLHGGGGLRLSGAHDILAETRRVVAFEVPGFGASPENTRTSSLEELAGTMNQAIAALGIDRFDVMGNSFGAKLALWMAIARPDAVESAVLIAPAAIRLDPPPVAIDPSVDPNTLLYAHPERQPETESPAPEIQAKQRALVRRLIGPPRERAFEQRLSTLEAEVLALFGTEDRVTPPQAAHLYREIIAKCHLVMVYDAAHAIDAERPEAVASVVEDFLTHHEGFLVRRKSGVIHP